MSECLILRDADVHEVLINLTTDGHLKFRHSILDALIGFSSTQEGSYQPEPSVIVRPDGRKTLFRPYTSSSGPGVKIVQHPLPQTSDYVSPEKIAQASKQSTRPTLHGVIAACDEAGFAKLFMASDELTAYRTSMSAMLLFTRQETPSVVVLFGAGKTALWHARLVLALKGNTIEKLVVINRSVSRARDLIEQIRDENEQHWRSPADFAALDPSAQNFEATLKQAVQSADAIFCTTGSKDKLFPAEYVLETSTKPGGRYISSIGSWQPDMVEIDPELLRTAATLPNASLVVDDRATTLSECGDIVQSGITASQVKEVGELLSSEDGLSMTKPPEGDVQSLAGALVIYKSIGVGITDLAAANVLADLARQAGKGIVVEDMYTTA